MIFSCVLAFIFVCSCTHGATVDFLFSTVDINANTDSLDLRCSLNEDAAAPVIGRRKRAVSHITSIVIHRTKNGVNETVADVSAFEDAKALVDLDTIQVDGTVNSPTSGEYGYLDLTWKNPTVDQEGLYICEIFALNENMYPENYVKTVDVTFQLGNGGDGPSIQEVMEYVHALENKTAQLEAEIAALKASGGGGSSLAQTGTVDCLQGTHDYTVTYDTPYSEVPTTLTAVAGAHDAEAYVFLPTVLSKTETGFTLRCTAFETVTVVWVSL